MKVSMLRLVCALAAAGCATAGVLAQPTSSPASQPKATPAPEQPKAPETPQSQKESYVELQTSMGNILVEVDGEKAPISAANFLTYVKEGFYDGTVFHRIINGFMIQGGGFTAGDKTAGSPEVVEKKPTHAAIKNEWTNGLKNKRGTIAMARTPDPNSATSQFYINVVDNDGTGPAHVNLDRPSGPPGQEAAYAVFGKVVAGMDVVDKIKAVTTHVASMGPGRSMRDVPATPVTIQKARTVSEEDAKKMMKGSDKESSKPADKPADKGGGK